MELPIKGRDIIAVCDDDEIRYVFRCNCSNEFCEEWRCSLTGSALLIKVKSWRYAD